MGVYRHDFNPSDQRRVRHIHTLTQTCFSSFISLAADVYAVNRKCALGLENVYVLSSIQYCSKV